MNKEQKKAYALGIVIILVQVLGIIALINMPNFIANLIVGLVMVLVMAFAIWKNFNFTKSAVIAQQFLKLIKCGDTDAKDTITALNERAAICKERGEENYCDNQSV